MIISFIMILNCLLIWNDESDFNYENWGDVKM